ncbi:protein WVD2-like 4 isoform X2 [Salvia splendens]|uniref:protein WVD2-like 4 isoform X2 n=1 Tax=Salvia splendens TaxID=180675 RepID=UPI001C26E4A4|nr:protein WVD2-like 4 isoform X2 [Salvia splendens]
MNSLQLSCFAASLRKHKLSIFASNAVCIVVSGVAFLLILGCCGASMGESLVERPTLDKKMDEPFKPSGGLDVSISFGRFENDVLSWEKWSSFSPNRYLEEVGSLSTPGSVAQKKAYFEAHYKRIAARKAEELEEEKSIVPAARFLDEWRNDDCLESSCGIDAELGLSNGDRSVEVAAESEYASTNATSANEAKKDDDSFDSSKEKSTLDVFVDGIRERDSADVGVESEGCLADEGKDELSCEAVELGPNAAVEAASPEMEKPPRKKNGVKELTPKSNVARKANSTKRDTNSGRVQAKPLPSSTPRNYKAAPVSTPTSASQPLMKRANGSQVTKSTRGASKSLHKSLILDPSSLPAQSMTRRSLMVEKMGDKDIIRRAFKTFQNRMDGSCNEAKSSTVKKVTSTPPEARVSTPPIRRTRDDAEKASAQRNQGGTRSKPSETRLYRGSLVMDTKNTNISAASSSISFRSHDRAKKRKEFLKDLEAKSVAKAAENAQLSAKSKEEKDSEIRRLRKSLNFKAKPLPSFYKDRTKAHLEKDPHNKELH